MTNTSRKKIVRLAIAAFAMLLTLAVTITSTYAWYTMAQAPNVQSFQMEAISETDMLLISALQDSQIDQSLNYRSLKYADTYKALIGQEEVEDLTEILFPVRPGHESEDGFANFVMGASTSVDGTVFTREVVTTPEVIAPNRSASLLGEGGYMSFQLRFRASVPGYVALANNTRASTATLAKSELSPIRAWKLIDDAQYNFIRRTATGDLSNVDIAANTQIYLSSLYAARYSFIDETSLAYLAYKPYATYVSQKATWDDAVSDYTAGIRAFYNNASTPSVTYPGFLASDPTTWDDASTLVADYEGSQGYAKSKAFYGAALFTYDELFVTKATMPTWADTIPTCPATVWSPKETLQNVLDSRVIWSNYYVFLKDGSSKTGNLARDYRNHIFNKNVTGHNNVNPNEVAFDTTKLIPLTLTETAGEDAGYYFGSMRVNIWLEGWDPNCCNSVLDDYFETSFVFKFISA